MYIGNLENKQLMSIALMIFFAFVVMFFLGYRYAYGKAVNYANEQIEEKVDDFKSSYGIQQGGDFILDNIKNIEVVDDGT